MIHTPKVHLRGVKMLHKSERRARLPLFGSHLWVIHSYRLDAFLVWKLLGCGLLGVGQWASSGWNCVCVCVCVCVCAAFSKKSLDLFSISHMSVSREEEDVKLGILC